MLRQGWRRQNRSRTSTIDQGNAMSLFGKKTPAAPAVAPDIEVEIETSARERPTTRERPKFNVDDAIQLMRTLPVDQHPDLVVLVVKNTLASMNVSLKDTLRDAAAKQESVSRNIAELKSGIAELEEQIRARKAQVSIAEAELAELNRVTERLESAVGAHEPTITPPGVVVRPATTATAPRPPLPPRSKPPTPVADAERHTIELPDSALEVEPKQHQVATGKP